MTDIPPAYVRANGEMLYKLEDKHACVLGKLGKVKLIVQLKRINYIYLCIYLFKIAANKLSFELTASDHKTITVKLKSALRDELTPFVEVYGISDGNGSLNCINYATFEGICYDNFGLYTFHFKKLIDL